ILGLTRSTLSVSQYEQVCTFVQLLGPKLPSYKTIKEVRKRLRKKFDFNVGETLSPLGKPCFGLQELGNPYVANSLEFIPKLPDSTTKVYCLSQSKKWREELDQDLRVQMIEKGQSHFYLYEPVQLKDKRIVVPFYFYQSGHDVFAKCVFACQNLVKEGESTKIRTEFQSVSAFDSPLFTTININTFWRVFDAIDLRNGQLMKDNCGEFMYGECFHISHCD
ncbi:hypothetical protein DFH28DRAFT_890929, partial [Melampsora americana]